MCCSCTIRVSRSGFSVFYLFLAFPPFFLSLKCAFLVLVGSLTFSSFRSFIYSSVCVCVSFIYLFIYLHIQFLFLLLLCILYLLIYLSILLIFFFSSSYSLLSPPLLSCLFSHQCFLYLFYAQYLPFVLNVSATIPKANLSIYIYPSPLSVCKCHFGKWYLFIITISLRIFISKNGSGRVKKRNINIMFSKSPKHKNRNIIKR